MEISREEFESLKRDIDKLKRDDEKTRTNMDLILSILKLMKKSMDDNNQEFANAINDIYKNYMPKSAEAISVIFKRLVEVEKAINTISLYLQMNNEQNIVNEDYDNITNMINSIKTSLNIDEILDKISMGGLDNLTDEEKDFLARGGKE